MDLDQSHLATLATRISTSSAMNPALLLCLMICPLTFVGAVSLFHLGEPLAALLMVFIGCWPLAIAGWQLIRFTLAEPDRLQREQHLEKMLQIRTQIGVKDGDIIRQFPVSGRLSQNDRTEEPGGE